MPGRAVLLWRTCSSELHFTMCSLAIRVDFQQHAMHAISATQGSARHCLMCALVHLDARCIPAKQDRKCALPASKPMLLMPAPTGVHPLHGIARTYLLECTYIARLCH